MCFLELLQMPPELIQRCADIVQRSQRVVLFRIPRQVAKDTSVLLIDNQANLWYLCGM